MYFRLVYVCVLVSRINSLPSSYNNTFYQTDTSMNTITDVARHRVSSYTIVTSRIENSIYELHNPWRYNMSNWIVVRRFSTAAIISKETDRRYRDIRYNLSLQHGYYEGYSSGNWAYFTPQYDYSYVPYGIWFNMLPKDSFNGVMVNMGKCIGVYDHPQYPDNKVLRL